MESVDAVLAALQLEQSRSESGLVTARLAEDDPHGHFASCGAALRMAVSAAGALKITNLKVETPGQLEGILAAAGFTAKKYEEASTPRSNLGGRVYTSTDYPASEAIPLHCELSYSEAYPRWVVFYCQVAAEGGGETSIASGVDIYREIRQEVRSAFEERGLRYVRNCRASLGLSWQQVFGTDSREAVESIASTRQMDVEWRDGGRTLRIESERRAVLSLENGEKSWFNQAHLFHPSGLPASTRDALASLFPDPRDLPRNCYFGDGEEVPEPYLDEIRRALDRHTRLPTWRQGDLMILDNYRTLHGRRPFRGERRILTVLSD